MIFDDFKNIDLYDIDDKVKDFILNIDLEIKTGRYEITEYAYINIDEYKTRKKETVKLEGHKKYIDIQFLIKGKERIYITDKSGLEITEKYDDKKDIEFYKTPDFKPLNKIYLDRNKFAIFYPDDIHSPCINFNNEEETVKKAVVKILI